VPLVLLGPPFFYYSFWVHHLVNRDDRHLLARAMAWRWASYEVSGSSRSGWPDVFVQKSPNMWPKLFFVKINAWFCSPLHVSDLILSCLPQWWTDYICMYVCIYVCMYVCM
jgi:hypothetical protein